ncbi:UNVERIFIED_CONTAM: hypothetical protein NCL1_19490 [Trichonephila clavipes]
MVFETPARLAILVTDALIGLRVEGLEKILKSFIGLKDKVPKVPTASPWNFLSSKDILGENDAEVSFYLRMFEDEILGFSASDLYCIGEMIQIADIMNKVFRLYLSDKKLTSLMIEFLKF